METDFSPAIFMQGNAHAHEACNRDCDAVPAAACETGNETHIYYEACENAKEVRVSASCSEDAHLGRVLDAAVTLRRVCPGRRSAVGLTLTEDTEHGQEVARGFRAISVPAHSASCPQDVALQSVRFVLPEPHGPQRRRHFILRTDHHYVDADWSGT